MIATAVVADDQVPAEPKPAGRPVIAADVRLKASSDVTADQILKSDGSATPAGAAMTETGGNVFLSTLNARLHFYPGISGSYITGSADGTSLTLYGMGGTINLRNADTVIAGFGSGTTAALQVKNVNSLPILYVENDGKVGIGTTSPGTKLHVWSDALANATITAGPDAVNGPALSIAYGGNTVGRGAGFLNVKPDAAAVAPNPSLRFQTADVERMIITNAGWVGIGTSNPGSALSTGQEAPLHVFSAADKATFTIVQNSSNTPNALAILRTWADTASMNLSSHSSARTVNRWGITIGGWNEVMSWAGNGLAVGTLTSTPTIIGTNGLDRVHITPDGKVGINTSNPTATLEVNGTIKATSVIGAVFQDVAEWVPATVKMAPGTVVVLNRQRDNEVMPSSHAYDTAVAGVVSEQPGVILGVAAESKAQIATTGRVKVHVDATAGAIAIGDLLVTGNKPGTAMKSQPIDLGGVAIHRPGTVIGKALQPLERGEGEILVLLSLQ